MSDPANTTNPPGGASCGDTSGGISGGIISGGPPPSGVLPPVDYVVHARIGNGTGNPMGTGL